MRRSLRVIGLVVILAAVAIAVQAGLGAGRRPTMRVEIISPPAGVALPAGQAVAVRYRVGGPAARAELWCDETLLATDATPAGRDLAHAWVPAGPGAACCTVTALDARGATLASAQRCLEVGPDSSPVRLGEP
jgi:hypothetical protein